MEATVIPESIETPADAFATGALEARFSAPEMRLLLACCRRALGTLDDEAWAERLAAPVDMRAFWSLCRRHRLTLIVNKVLLRSNESRPGLLHSAKVGADAECKRIAQSQLRLSKLMVDVHRALSGAGVRHAFLKGPLLNHLLYGDELLRHSGDLDLLIDGERVRQAHACLRALGYRPEGLPRGLEPGSRLLRLRRKDITYRAEANGAAIELHWKTDAVETLLRPGLFAWDTHVVHHGFRGERLPAFRDDFHLLYLCLHAARHNWTRLRWLMDIPELINKRDLDHKNVFALADAHGLRKPLQEAFFLSETLLGCRFGCRARDPQGRAGARVEQGLRWEGEPDSLTRYWALARLQASLYPGLRLKLEFLIQRLWTWALSRRRRK